jgi:hypothetical protein
MTPTEESFGFNPEQAAAFQRIWLDSATKMFQSAFTSSLDSPPPEMLKQIRSGIFAALAQSWDEFMRSPQFLDSMKQWMENAISFRKMSNDLMARARTELQAPSRDDTDMLMLSIRHMEKRLLDRIEELDAELKALKQEINPRPRPTTKRKTVPRKQRQRA